MATGNTYSARMADAYDTITRLQGDLTFLDATAEPSYGKINLYSYAFTYATAGLATGVTLTTLTAGSIIYDVGIVITTAFDGTTPSLDVGTFDGGNVGLFAELAAVVDGTKVYADVTDNAGLASSNSQLWLSTAIGSAGAAGGAAFDDTALYVSADCSFLLVASQNGQKSGTAIDSTAGAGRVYIVAAAPNVLA
jgi:hypothetical protein